MQEMSERTEGAIKNNYNIFLQGNEDQLQKLRAVHQIYMRPLIRKLLTDDSPYKIDSTHNVYMSPLI